MANRKIGWSPSERWKWIGVLAGYVLLAVVALSFLPDWLVDQTLAGSSVATPVATATPSPPAEPSEAPQPVSVSPVDRLTAVASARQSILLAAGGGLAVLTLVLTISRDAITRDRADRESDEHVTSLYIEALKQLGDRESTSARIGGIYALERIAQDSSRDKPAVKFVLASFLREYGTRPFGSSSDPAVATDHAAAAEALGRLGATPEAAGRLELDEVNVYRLRLNEADFTQANMSFLFAREASLEDSILFSTRLYAAQLRSALLSRADLRHASLGNADLTGAYMVGAKMDGADLDGTKLFHTNLKGVTGLTSEQVDKAFGWTAKTRWPDGFTPPEPERKADQMAYGNLAHAARLDE